MSTNGRYAFGIKPTIRGTFTYRVVWYADADADADHQGTQTISKVLTVS